MGVARRLPSSTRFLNGRKRSLGLPKSRVAGSNPVAHSTNPQVYQGDSQFPSVGPTFHRDLSPPAGILPSVQNSGLTQPEFIISLHFSGLL